MRTRKRLYDIEEESGGKKRRKRCIQRLIKGEEEEETNLTVALAVRSPACLSKMYLLALPFLELLAEKFQDSGRTLVDREFWEDVSVKYSSAQNTYYSPKTCKDTAQRLAHWYLSVRTNKKDLEMSALEYSESFSGPTQPTDSNVYKDLFHKIFGGDSKAWEMVGVDRSSGQFVDESSASDSRGFQDTVIRQPRYSTLHQDTDWRVMTSLAQLAQDNLVNLNDIAFAQSSLSTFSYAAFAFLNAKDNNTKVAMIHSPHKRAWRGRKGNISICKISGTLS